MAQFRIASPAGREIGILTPAEGIAEQELRRLMRKPGRIQLIGETGEGADPAADA